MLRFQVCVESVASILSNTSRVMSCSVASTSSQSPAMPDTAWVMSLRPKLAAKPIAAPPSAAAMIGPLSPHENALRSLELRLPPLERLRVDDERLDCRLWVRVAINSSLAEFAGSTVRGRAPFLLRGAFKPPFGAFVRRCWKAAATLRKEGPLRASRPAGEPLPAH